VSEPGPPGAGGSGTAPARTHPLVAAGDGAYAQPTSVAAERRQLTILFCDLVGSTRLSHRLDPEEYHTLLMRYRAICVRFIEHYGGSEIRHVGDGTQAYFGYPRAMEDAAERAVLTALAIVEAIGRQAGTPRAARAELAVRIGIGSGPVITDPRSAPDGAGNRVTEALGETPNLAARIQSVAPVNGVVVGPLTRELIGNLFTLIDRGEQDFKGIDRPVRVWQVAGIAAMDRFEATRPTRAALVNREREMSALLGGWEAAQAGRGTALVLLGEGGIGKSRLVRELQDRIVRQALPSSVFLQCSPIHRNTALYPVIVAFESRAGLRPGDSAADKLAKLWRLLERSSVSGDRLVPLIAALLDIEGASERSEPPVDWRELRERLVVALVEHVRRLAERRPLLIVIEDLQWIDPSTSELLERAVRAIADCRVMIVGVGRTGVLLPWFGLGHVETIPLERFSPGDTTRLAGLIAGGRALPSEVVHEIVDKSGGVPLFVEEIVKSLMSGGLLRTEGDTCVLDEPLPPLAIPPTLTDLLMARLDRLGEARRHVQIGAVIGREFTLELLASVSAEAPEPVAASLESLVLAGILDRWLAATGAVYSFSHALMREVALGSMLRSQRQRLHATVARVLETRFAPIGRANPEVLARHYSDAALAPQAIDHWLLAGARASARSETLEAIGHFRSGLALIPLDDPEAATGVRHLDLLIALAPALITHIGPGAEEVRETYRRALALCERLPESAAHFAAYWGWWRISRNFDDKRDAANTLLALAERLGDPGLALEAHHALWATSFVLGEQSASLEYVRQGLALYADGDYRDHASIYGGHDAQVCGEGEAALVLWLTGNAREAGRRIDRALSLAERLEHVGSRAHALDYALMLHVYRGDVETVRRYAESQLALAADNHLGDYEVRARVFLGWALGLAGEREGALQSIRKGVHAQRDSGTTEDFPIFFAMQAEVHLRHAQTEEAEAMLIEASDYAAEQHVRVWDAEIHRLRAVVELQVGRRRTAAAAEHLRQALAIASRQGARMLSYKTVETIHWAFDGAVDGAVDGVAGRDAIPDPSTLDRAMRDVLRGDRDIDPASSPGDPDLRGRRGTPDRAGCARLRAASALLGRHTGAGTSA